MAKSEDDLVPFDPLYPDFGHVDPDNPFLPLFAPRMPVRTVNKAPPPPPAAATAAPTSPLTSIMESAFLFTLNPAAAHSRLYLSDLRSDLGSDKASFDDPDVVDRAIFERITMPAAEVTAAAAAGRNVASSAKRKRGASPPEAPQGHLVEAKVIVFLAEAYRRLCEARRSRDDESLGKEVERIKSVVVMNAVTASREPDLYDGQDMPSQFLEVLRGDEACMEYNRDLRDFLEAVFAGIKEEDGEGGIGVLQSVVRAILDDVAKELKEAPFMFLNARQTRVLEYLADSPAAAMVLIIYNFPLNTNSQGSGRLFADTLLGSLLSKSCIPVNEMTQSEHFDRPGSTPASAHAAAEQRIWTALEGLGQTLHDVFKKLLANKNEDVRHFTLLWIGECFKANSGRGKMWTNQMGPMLSQGYVSDGFMLNLGGVLLRLCAPFIAGRRNPKMLRVNLTYAACKCDVSEDSRSKGVHLRNIAEETCLVPAAAAEGEEEREPNAASFNFITDIFFLAHKCLDLGFRVVQEKFIKLNQELNRTQELYRESRASGGDVAEQIQQRMDAAMTKYLTIKAALLEPETLRLMMEMTSATCDLLVQAALAGDKNELGAAFQEVSFPIDASSSAPVPRLLRCVPEFFVENLCEHLLLARRFCPGHFEESGADALASVLNFILVFMGSPRWVHNPHLRARTAEALECLLPMHKVQQPGGNVIGMGGSFHREQLFTQNPERLEIVPALLDVFVNIEATGQAVEFEQKFSYRRPMYDVMRYLWELEDFQEKFASLAAHSEEHIEDEDAPIFLRFVNLLINDAIFLLDEALGYMKQIGEQQAQKEEWARLPPQERAEAEGQYHHMGRLARYHNIMGKETIEMLDKLSGKISAVFTHPTMVDRIAAMLNYFLKQLVGPDRKSFKVQNIESYEFRPGQVVTTICKVYVNFTSCQAFVDAVSRDGRSYSPELFRQAEGVLLKIGNDLDLIGDLQDLAVKVKESAASQEADEALFADAPEHFLDAIMSVLMRDPVKLPSSGQIVDRQTIARHLLSDQNDPFNRDPLSLDKVIPQEQLKEEIQKWMEEKRQSGSGRGNGGTGN